MWWIKPSLMTLTLKLQLIWYFQKWVLLRWLSISSSWCSLSLRSWGWLGVETKQREKGFNIYFPIFYLISQSTLRMFDQWLEEKQSLREERTSLREEQALFRTEREALRRERGDLENEREEIRRSRMSLEHEKEQMRRDQDRGDNRWTKSYNWWTEFPNIKCKYHYPIDAQSALVG